MGFRRRDVLSVLGSIISAPDIVLHTQRQTALSALSGEIESSSLQGCWDSSKRRRPRHHIAHQRLWSNFPITAHECMIARQVLHTDNYILSTISYFA